MQLTHITLSAIAALASTAQAVGSAQVFNNCGASVYLWSVGSSTGSMKTIAKGTTYSETFHRDSVSGGISLKITRKADGLFNGSPQTIFAYSLDGNNIWYDMSDVFGDAFSGSKLSVVPSINTCPSIVWPVGVNPGGSQVKVCSANANVKLTLCA